jgi:hypothetical protein
VLVDHRDIVMGFGPIVPNEDHPAPLLDAFQPEPEKNLSDLMDQCSNGTTSHQPSALLTRRQGHDLGVEVNLGSGQCSPAGGSKTSLARTPD